jgi:hypothetical protein
LRTTSAGGLQPGEQPILWFSTATFWEPTANKAVADATDPTGSRWLSMKETALICRGLFRFGALAKERREQPINSKRKNEDL